MKSKLVKLALMAGVAWGATAAADELAARRTLAQTALLVADYDRAITLADEILATWPGDEGAHLIRGLALAASGEFERAEGDLLIAREAYPDDASVRYNLALLLHRRGDHREALSHLDGAFARGLNKAGAYLFKAQLLDRLGRRSEARETLEYYLTRRPGTRDMYLTLAQWARADGDNETAIAYYDEALQHRRDGNTLAELAATYEASGDRDRAIEYYFKAIAKGAGHADLLADYASDYTAAGDFGKSLDIYERLINKYPGNAHYLFGYSFVKQQLGEEETAHAGYLKVVRLKPDFAEAHFNLGALADADENAAEAVSYYRKFLKYSAGRDDLADSRAKVQERIRVLEGS